MKYWEEDVRDLASTHGPFHPPKSKTGTTQEPIARWAKLVKGGRPNVLLIANDLYTDPPHNIRSVYFHDVHGVALVISGLCRKMQRAVRLRAYL